MTRGRESAYISTFTGKSVTVFNPRPEDIDIEDIAHALSMLCRYTGHCPRFYSVADHSLYVSQAPEVVAANAQLEGLLHDASEAYLVDIARPVKRFLPDYQDVERTLDGAIRARFRLGEPSAAVKLADARMLVTEARSFGFPWWQEWADRGIKPYNFYVVPRKRRAVKAEFLTAFGILGGYTA